MNLNESAIYENEEIQELMQSVSIHMTPSLLHIKEQEVKNRIEDNVNEEELNSWFAQR